MGPILAGSFVCPGCTTLPERLRLKRPARRVPNRVPTSADMTSGKPTARPRLRHPRDPERTANDSSPSSKNSDIPSRAKKQLLELSRISHQTSWDGVFAGR